MTQDLELGLVRRFPSLFRYYGGDPRETCMAWGGAHGDGWFELLAHPCGDIERGLDGEDFFFRQIKEKFGELRVSYEGGNERTAELIAASEERSTTICEMCGAPGRLDLVRPRWLQTLCNGCRNTEQGS